MLNQFVIVGILKSIPELLETPNRIKYTDIVLQVKRNFKNSIGEYDSDEITCRLWRGIAENTVDICDLNSLVAIKGRIQSCMVLDDNSKVSINYEFIAEKVSILNEEN